jgi:hypothetical protein
MSSERFPAAKLNLDTIKSLFQKIGCKNLYVKELAWNHDSKRQIYLTPDLSAFNMLPSNMEFVTDRPGGIAPTQKKKNKGSNRIFGHLTFAWLSLNAEIDEAKHAKLIFYPQYPEVRFSGFLKGTTSIPSQFLKEKSGEKFPNRILFLATDKVERTYGFLAVGHRSLREELRHEPGYSVDAGLNRISIYKGEKDESKLIRILSTIHAAGWQRGARLQRGKLISYNASNAVGYTLEALLGVEPNGINAPDYAGFEVKALTVSNFDKPSNKVVTVFTPEPNVGLYAANFLKFMQEYGYEDLRGRKDRRNFGGIHRVGVRHNRTRLLLSLAGFISTVSNKYDAEGQLQLVDEAKRLAAGWTFAKLIDGWKNKHEKAVYVPAMKRTKNSKCEFWFGNRIQLCHGADFLLVLKCLMSGDLFLDPGVKAENWSAKQPNFKKRNQFRTKASNLPKLYLDSKTIKLPSTEG